MSKKDPSFFKDQNTLIRCITDANMQRGRVSSAAYKISKKSEEYLSVCCKEIGDTQEIITYFHHVVLKEQGNKVVSTNHTIKEINRAANNAKNNLIKYGKEQGFLYDNAHASYENIPSQNKQYASIGKSHCGIMFVKILNEFEEHSFAQELSNNISKNKSKLTVTPFHKA